MNDNKYTNCDVIECNCTKKEGVVERRERLLHELEQEECSAKIIGEKEIQEIYHNACLYKDSVELIRPLSKNRRFRNLLLRQHKEYSELIKEVENQAKLRNVELKNTGVFATMMMHVTTFVNTLNDKSASKLSQIMLQGINMGVISVTKLVNRLEENDKNCSYARRLLDLLNKSSEEMKLFL